jgi:hypothetical protein
MRILLACMSVSPHEAALRLSCPTSTQDTCEGALSATTTATVWYSPSSMHSTKCELCCFFRRSSPGAVTQLHRTQKLYNLNPLLSKHYSYTADQMHRAGRHMLRLTTHRGVDAVIIRRLQPGSDARAPTMGPRNAASCGGSGCDVAPAAGPSYSRTPATLKADVSCAPAVRAGCDMLCHDITPMQPPVDYRKTASEQQLIWPNSQTQGQ